MLGGILKLDSKRGKHRAQRAIPYQCKETLHRVAVEDTIRFPSRSDLGVHALVLLESEPGTCATAVRTGKDTRYVRARLTTTPAVATPSATWLLLARMSASASPLPKRTPTDLPMVPHQTLEQLAVTPLHAPAIKDRSGRQG